MMRALAPGTVTDTTRDGGWTPVRVVARLAEPVINLDGHACHLDGPAAFGAYLDYVAARGHHTLPLMGHDAAVDFTLPLATWTAPAPGPVHELARAADAGRVWGWACSRALYTPAGHTTIPVRRRPSVDEAARYTADGKWHLAAGPWKARDTPHQAVLVEKVTWYALADPQALLVLLRRVHGLGRHARHGNGRVLRWDVVPDPEAAKRWRQRVWPDPAGLPGTIRAPYHHPTRRMPCTWEALAC